MAPAEVLLKTARAYIRALDSLDIDGLRAITTPDFSIFIGPASTRLGADDGTATRDVFLQRFTGMKKLVRTLHTQIVKEWPPNEASNQVTLHAVGDTEWLPEVVGDDDPKEWDWKGEVLMILTMDESGEKVKHKFDFTDSSEAAKMTELFKKATTKLQMDEIVGAERVQVQE